MARGRNKYQSRENRARVRKLLLHEWDPIGVADVPEASDEYDRYADEAYVMLMERNAGTAQIAAYLLAVATDNMGLSRHPELEKRCNGVADRLVFLRPEFLTH